MVDVAVFVHGCIGRALGELGHGVSTLGGAQMQVGLLWHIGAGALSTLATRYFNGPVLIRP